MKTIKFNQLGYEQAKRDLNNIVDVINKYSEHLTDSGIYINKDDIEVISKDINKYRNYIFHYKLKEIADSFGIEYNMIKTIEYSMQNPLFRDMALKKCEVVFKFIKELGYYIYGKAYLIDYIDILDNIATISINAELKEYFTEYTINDKEDSILEKLNKLQIIYKELKEMGVSKRESDNLINNYDYSIDVNYLHKLSKK